MEKLNAKDYFYARLRFDPRISLGRADNESPDLIFYLYAEDEMAAYRKMDIIETTVRLELDRLFSDWEDAIKDHYRENNGIEI